MLFSSEYIKTPLKTLSDVEEIVKNVTTSIELGESTEAHENYALCLFLIIGFIKSKLVLPIEFIKREAPDFLLTLGDEQIIGLEHTIATTEKYKMDEKIFDTYPEGSLLELPYYSPNQKLPKKSRIAMRRPGEKLQSAGWGDYGMEKDWVLVISNNINQKTEVLNKKHYEKFPSNELIVEDESHVSSQKRLGKSISMLKENRLYLIREARLEFDKIHLVTEGHLIYDVFGEDLETSIRKNELCELWRQHVRSLNGRNK
jgi:hypothetical protein